MKTKIKKCAVYTRKSTEEGLDQDFNTLDAQREACLAFITSQKEEGWVSLPAQYDDGGYTGGNMDRPALQKLLKDIRAGEVNTIVVYKIDRLTRSLADFSKLVDIFDQYEVTFVSVTQSFNTTTSMGRLTLNILLSFAQFEREIIGERVRDKVLASRKRGIWMGGSIPIGYKIENKQLLPNPEYVGLVGTIFKTYLELGCVRKLAREFKKKNITTPIWKSLNGTEHGGKQFSAGHIYWVLRNPVYIGKSRHKKHVYDGQHPPIIDKKLWDDVQTKLNDNNVTFVKKRKQNSLLQGKLFDQEGTIYSPTYTKKGGKRYLYYISQNLLKYRDHPDELMARLPATEIDELIRSTMRKAFVAPQDLATYLNVNVADHHSTLEYITDKREEINNDLLIQDCIKRITLSQSKLQIIFDCNKLLNQLVDKFKIQETIIPSQEEYIVSSKYVVSRSRRGAIMIDAPPQHLEKSDPFNRPEHEVQNWIKGTVWRDMHFRGKTIQDIAKLERVSQSYVSRLIDQSLDLPNHF